MTTILRIKIVRCNTPANSNILKAIAKSNIQNLTGDVNYNFYGIQDGVGFVPVGEKYIDSFILQVDVRSFNIESGNNLMVSRQNKTIRQLLRIHDMDTCTVRAFGLKKLNEELYRQSFKITCFKNSFDIVAKFIRNKHYGTIGMRLQDVDVVRDFAGTFDKQEVAEYLRSHGYSKDGDELPIILNNDKTVGGNCLSALDYASGSKIFTRMYNKMVQMLESQAVRRNIGCLWKDWICETDTPLAKSRDAATMRGLTRVRTSFNLEYFNLPSDNFIEHMMGRLIEAIPKSLVYSTPYTAIWKSYCDSLKHTLICVHKTADVALLVYSYNQHTKKISGQIFNNWGKVKHWCINKLTFNLPIDVIEVEETEVLTMKNKKLRKDGQLEIRGVRYEGDDGNTTRIVSRNGLFSYNHASKEQNVELLKKAGFVEHKNCIAFLATHGKRTLVRNLSIREEIFVFT